MRRKYTPTGYKIILETFMIERKLSMNKDNIYSDGELKEELSESLTECPCRRKNKPRDEKTFRSLKNRLNRMSGQLSGISGMLDDNRYCGDILIQVAALQSALRAFGCEVLKNHMETCVTDEIKKGNTEIIDETLELIKKLR